jgi:hypothetical protein
MLSIRKTLALFATAGSLVVGVNPAHAFTVSTTIQNLPRTLPLANSTTNLQFGALNANLPGINSLGLNQYYKLNSASLTLKGKVAGSFTIENSSFNPINVSSPALTYILDANNLNSTNNSTTNATSPAVPAATVTAASFTPGPPSPPPTAACSGSWAWGGTFWLCYTPGSQSFSINTGGSYSTVNWEVANGTGATNPVASSFWSGPGNSILLPAQLEFSFINSAFTGGSLGSFSGNFELSTLTADSFLTYNYDILTRTAVPAVPAPLPLFGAGVGFGFTRRLRRRIKSATVAS